jgi:hypothetical protein
MSDSRPDWSTEGPNILSPEILKAVEQTLARRGSVIVEHRVMCGGGNPYKLVFDDLDDFLGHLKANARPGDNILVWCYDELCRDDNLITRGKYPGEKGRTPLGGAY